MPTSVSSRRRRSPLSTASPRRWWPAYVNCRRWMRRCGALALPSLGLPRPPPRPDESRSGLRAVVVAAQRAHRAPVVRADGAASSALGVDRRLGLGVGDIAHLRSLLLWRGAFPVGLHP